MLLISGCFISENKAEKTIDSIMNSSEFNSMDINNQVIEIQKELEELEKKGYIKKDSIKYNENEMLYTYVNSDGTLAGVSLKDFGDEYDSAVDSAEESNIADEMYVSSEASGDIDALILNAFENTSFRMDYYNNLVAEWNSKGIDTKMDTEVTIDDLKSLTDHDVIIFAAHGAEIENQYAIWINQKVTDKSNHKYHNDLKKSIYNVNTKEGRMYWVTSSFFSDYYQTNQVNSKLVYVQSCMFFGCDCTSVVPNYTYASVFDNIFNNASIIGYHNSVNSYYSRDVMKATVDNALDGYSVGDALDMAKVTYGQNDNTEDVNEGKYIAYPIIYSNPDNCLINVEIDDCTIPSDMKMKVGEIDVIEPVIIPDNASNYSIKWSSSNESVITVTSEGKSCIVNAISKGNAVITAEIITAENVIRRETSIEVSSQGRDSVLVLDVSASMADTPIKEMKEAALQFCDDIIKNNGDNRIGIVLYTDDVQTHNLTDDINSLKSFINGINTGNMTGMEAGLSKAKEMLDSYGRDDCTKNIIIMADGLPNIGATSYSGSFSYQIGSADDSYIYENAVLDTANEIMDTYNMYSLGFFHNINDLDYQYYSSEFMKRLTNKNNGYYEVTDAEKLQFVFDDMSETVSSGSKTVINIACPVDVTVNYNGEIISSANDNFIDTASYGKLILLGKNKDIKTLILDAENNYDITLNGTDIGVMDYSVNYYSDDEKLYDERRFSDVPIIPSTIINTNTDNTGNISLYIDEDGDGDSDYIWSEVSGQMSPEILYLKATPEPYEPEAEYIATDDSASNASVIIVICIIMIFVVIGIIILAVCIKKAKKHTKKEEEYDIPIKQINNASIKIMTGKQIGTEYIIKADSNLYIGKSFEHAQIRIDSSYKRVSRIHCMVSYDALNQVISITDLSSNGTYIAENMGSGYIKKDKLQKNKLVTVDISKTAKVIMLADDECVIRLESISK